MLHSPIPRQHIGIAMYMMELNHFILFKKQAPCESKLPKSKKPEQPKHMPQLDHFKTSEIALHIQDHQFSISLTKKGTKDRHGN